MEIFALMVKLWFWLDGTKIIPFKLDFKIFNENKVHFSSLI